MRSRNNIYLTNTSNDLLVHRLLIITIILLLQYRISLYATLINSNYSNTYTIISKIIVPRLYKTLQLESISLSKLKSLREYNDKLVKKSITYYLLLNLSVSDYKERTCSILITPLDIYNIILKKLQINKYEVLLNILKNKILFVPERYNHDSNKVS